MDLDALRFGDLTKLGEAVTDWEQMTAKLATLKGDAQDNLKAKSDKAKWAGVNASVSREFIDRTAAEFTDAHTQADSIAKILRDTHKELLDYRTQLSAAVERGAGQGLTVLDTGAGTFQVTRSVRPDWASDPSGKGDAESQKAAETLRDEIQLILGKATESDSSAAKVLTLLADQAEYGFTDAQYADRDSAAKAVAAAEQLAKQAKDPAKMTLADITAFNRTMELYRDDPLFSEQFATRLGPKGTLQFWTEMSVAHAGARGSEVETMKNLQQNLSLTLATASFSESDAMKEWKKDLIAESNTNFRASGSTNPIGALGSQVISSLMRQGQYDTEFLDTYREKLFKADKGAGESNTDALWLNGGNGPDLVFGDGSGRDPLEGLFEGLSHNPEAATHAFESKEDLDHMLGTIEYTDRGASLGRALEAAVIGAPAGDPTYQALPHSAAQVDIMANIMSAVAQPGGGEDLVKHGMGESFGHMAASYMPEISQKLGGPNSEASFLTNSEKPDGLEQTDIARFLSAVALDPSGRAGIIYGESIYTGSLLEAHLTDASLFEGPREQVLEDIGKNAGIIEGIVGHAIADAEIKEAADSEKDHNDGLETQGDLFNTAISAGAGGLAALAPLPFAPVAAIGSAALTGVAGTGVKRIFEGMEIEGSADMAIYRTGQDLNAFQDSVSQQTQWSVRDALDLHNIDLPRDGIDSIVRNAVNEGWDSSGAILGRSKERPN
ncbi:MULTISPECIES: hypothetical protein [unclassified Streptomyces]|uniref:hypothetical protein n=1 Tax=unclassified Streptomyces TaxID=2593676 RepID=UPI000DD52552|nr:MULTISPECIES: hypothetical protein [unclassified Streptomyces]QZZ29248.1 hypothetical protein A7X85_26025 [Streptomyces sp. ST1015]